MSAGIESTIEFEGVEPITVWLHREEAAEGQMAQNWGRDGDGGSVIVNFSYEWREGQKKRAEKGRERVKVKKRERLRVREN